MPAAWNEAARPMQTQESECLPSLWLPRLLLGEHGQPHKKYHAPAQASQWWAPFLSGDACGQSHIVGPHLRDEKEEQWRWMPPPLTRHLPPPSLPVRSWAHFSWSSPPQHPPPWSRSYSSFSSQIFSPPGPSYSCMHGFLKSSTVFYQHVTGFTFIPLVPAKAMWGWRERTSFLFSFLFSFFLIFAEPGLVLCWCQVASGAHNIFLQEIALSHSRAEETRLQWG